MCQSTPREPVIARCHQRAQSCACHIRRHRGARPRVQRRHRPHCVPAAHRRRDRPWSPMSLRDLGQPARVRRRPRRHERRAFAAAAARYPNLDVADWNAAVGTNPAFVYSDGIHLTPAGQGGDGHAGPRARRRIHRLGTAAGDARHPVRPHRPRRPGRRDATVWFRTAAPMSPVSTASSRGSSSALPNKRLLPPGRSLHWAAALAAALAAWRRPWASVTHPQSSVSTRGSPPPGRAARAPRWRGSPHE